MLYKAQPSAVQCCGGRGPGKGRNDCVLCVSADLSQCPSDAGSPVIRAGDGLGLVAVFGGKPEAWTHGSISVSSVQKSKLMVGFFSTLIYLIFFGDTRGREDVTRLQKSTPMLTLLLNIFLKN